MTRHLTVLRSAGTGAPNRCGRSGTKALHCIPLHCIASHAHLHTPYEDNGARGDLGVKTKPPKLNPSDSGSHIGTACEICLSYPEGPWLGLGVWAED